MITSTRKGSRAHAKTPTTAPAASLGLGVGDWRGWPRDPWAWAVLAVCALVLVISVSGITVPLDRDEGAFLAIAQAVLHGRIPYRDAFDQKGPGIYYFLAAVLTLTSPLSKIGQILVARALVALINLATAAGLIRLGHRWWNREVGALAALLWLFAMPLYGGAQFFTEPFAVAFVVWAVAIASERPGVRGAFVGGTLVALGAIFKQTAVLALPGVAIVVVATAKPGASWWRPTRERLTQLGALVGGAVAPWVIVSGLFALVGALGPMVDQVLVSNLVRYPADARSAILSSMRTDIQSFKVLWYMPVGAAAVGLWRWTIGIGKIRRAPSVGALTVAAIGLLNLAPFKSHAYAHYWLQVVPWAALLAAVGYVAVLDAWRARPTGGASAIPMSHGLRALLAPALLMLILILTSGRSLVGSEARVYYPGLRNQVAIGAWIAQYAPPGTRLLVAPAEPEYYYLADRLPSTSYVYILPINLSPAFLAHLTDQVRAGQFDVVAWQQGGGGGGHEPYYAGLYQTLQQHYHIVAANTASQLYIFVVNRPADQSTVPRGVIGRHAAQ